MVRKTGASTEYVFNKDGEVDISDELTYQGGNGTVLKRLILIPPELPSLKTGHFDPIESLTPEDLCIAKEMIAGDTRGGCITNFTTAPNPRTHLKLVK